MHRHGVLELLVVLADGSKTLIPSDWTNAATAAASAEAGTLGSLRDLLRAVAVVAALLPAGALAGERVAGDE